MRAFRYADRAIFFARDQETRDLASLVSVYRGVLLYGDSGAGKSSLLEAGLVPLMIERGFAPVRIRVQPREDAELVIESLLAGGEPHSASAVSDAAAGGDPSARAIQSVSGLVEYLAGVLGERRPFLIFDQFEELVTLFDTPPAREPQRRLTALIADLLHGPLRIKLLLAFRDDYLGRLKELLADCPELVDQALRLAAPSVDALPTIISGPFERYPDHFEHPLPPAVREKLLAALADRFGTGEVSLSEVQIVCLRLWQSADPEALFEQRAVQGLLEDYLGEAIDQMPPQLQGVAIALLAQMITGAGTRNVISAADLFERVREHEARTTSTVLEQALERLSQSRLVRRERRRDLDLYEITTEFLVPWIINRREEHRQRRERRRLIIVGSIATALVVVAAGVAALALWALTQRQHAQTEAAAARTEATDARSLALATDANAAIGSSPSAPLLISLAALAPYKAGPASPTIAMATMVRTLQHAESQRLIGVMQDAAHPIYSVAFSPGGRTLAAGTDDGVVLRDTAGDARLAWLSAGTNNTVYSVAFSPDGRILATGTGNGTVLLWDTARHTQLASLSAGTSNAVYGVAFSPDGRTLAAGTDNGTVLLWGTAHHTQLASLQASNEPVGSVAFSPDGRTLAAAAESGAVLLWDTARHAQLASLPAGKTNLVGTVAFSPDGRTLAAGTDNGKVLLWDTARHTQLASLSAGNTNLVESVAFSPDGRTLAAGTASGKVLLWDTAHHTRLGSPSAGANDGVGSVAFSPDGRTLAGGTDHGAVLLWNTAPRTQLARLSAGANNAVYSVAFSPDGRTLAAGAENGVVLLWDTAHRTRLASLTAGTFNTIQSVAFSPDGRTLAGATDNGAVLLWDTARHTQLASLSAGTNNTVDSVAFSPDGGTLAAGTREGTVLLWDTAR
ncbi:MAG: hypothetical protein ACLPZR_28310, partial [Solirubrobacteraceae bacterium]